MPKSVWDKIKPTTFEAIAQLANTITPAEISRAQYVILMEAVVSVKEQRESKTHNANVCIVICSHYDTWVFGNWEGKLDKKDSEVVVNFALYLGAKRVKDKRCLLGEAVLR